jgi:hypothetical protein
LKKVTGKNSLLIIIPGLSIFLGNGDNGTPHLKNSWNSYQSVDSIWPEEKIRVAESSRLSRGLKPPLCDLQLSTVVALLIEHFVYGKNILD